MVHKNNIKLLICWQSKLQSGEPMDRWIDGSIVLIDWWMDGSMDLWMNGWIDRSINWSMDRLMDILINGLIDRLIGWSIDGLMDWWMDGCIDRSMDWWINQCIGGWINGLMDRLMDQSMYGWRDGGMDCGAFYEGGMYQSMGSAVKVGGGGGGWGEGQVVGRQLRDRFCRGA